MSGRTKDSPLEALQAPYPGKGSRIMLTAWNRIDRFDELDEDCLVRFIGTFRGHTLIDAGT